MLARNKLLAWLAACASSRALLSLLNDILDYSKIEAGKVALEEEEFSPEDTIETVGDLFSAKIEEAGLELVFEIDEQLPQRLVGDSLRLALEAHLQTVRNGVTDLSNALTARYLSHSASSRLKSF